MVVGGSAVPSYTWDVMVFVQGWPPSQCVFLEDEVRDKREVGGCAHHCSSLSLCT